MFLLIFTAHIECGKIKWTKSITLHMAVKILHDNDCHKTLFYCCDIINKQILIFFGSQKSIQGDRKDKIV